MPIDSHLPQADPFSLVPTFNISTRKVAQHKGKAMPISCIQQSCWYFRPSFVICTLPVPPSLPSLWLRLPPFLCQSTVSTDIACLGGGGGVEWPVGDKFLQRVLHSVSDHIQNFRTYKIATPPHEKIVGGEAASDRKHLQQSPFPGHIF